MMAILAVMTRDFLPSILLVTIRAGAFDDWFASLVIGDRGWATSLLEANSNKRRRCSFVGLGFRCFPTGKGGGGSMAAAFYGSGSLLGPGWADWTWYWATYSIWVTRSVWVVWTT
ncbi:hypothetical protein RchiOBHm_Chr4g0407841 [Rosa chinensis]|uniref:Uncharacterized protein n=1 Tax=Rosa chinensis TaxID=74649 RepID=A0A2P6QUP6_ROSCH|nr:hypothetical protein RchiOBHm_Chr4g0407841 [Rosa chinensis]